MENPDCIVLGASGGVGSAALYHLSRRGCRVLGIDRFPPGHDRGSSHGDTRIIRMAYMEHPDYVPLMRTSYRLWKELEAATGENLLVETGLLQAGPGDGEVVTGVLESARRHALDVEELDAAEVRKRFPGFRVEDDSVAVLEPGAGYLRVESCVRAHAEMARRHGAELRVPETVRGWRVDGEGVVVDTDAGSYRAGRLVIAPGAWAPQLLSSLNVPFEVVRKPLLWYRTRSSAYRADRDCPAYLFEVPGGIFYGFPEIAAGEIKMAEHSGGEIVNDPLTVDRSLRDGDRDPVESFAARHLPDVTGDCLRHVVCLYTRTPDQHFVVDRHPEHPQISFACGLSGHGFKFTSVLGQILADLTLEGKTEEKASFLGLHRFQAG